MTRSSLRARLKGALFCFMSVLALSACATATPYQPLASASSRSEGGYSDAQLAPGRWQVTFAGNSLTSRETVEGYLLYRAAELTLEQGGKSFEIVRRDIEHEIRDEIVSDPYDRYDPWWGYPRWRPNWRYYGRPYGWQSWYPGSAPFFDTQRVERFEARTEILIHPDGKLADNTQIFDAAEVLGRLGSSIQRPK